MKKKIAQNLLPLLFCLIAVAANSQSIPVVKTNPTKVYVHYMPWFTAPDNPGPGATNFGNGNTGTYNKWGQHWSKVGASTKYPDNFIPVTAHNGDTVEVRDICAHYHPLIGPYNGSDTAVLEYHLLLMKLSGIDGVLIDWYGQAGLGVGDAGPLLANSNALISQSRNAGLKYGLVMEDAGWKGLAAGQSNGAYAIINYFSDSQYIKLGDMRGSAAANATAPLVCVFGPQQFKTPGQWNSILGGNTQSFLPLYNQSGPIGADAGGEFAWPYPQAALNGGTATSWYTNLNSYYSNNAAAKNVVLGSAFPGFNDFYGANGADQLGVIGRTYNGTTTLDATLALSEKNKPVLDGIQLATWNDFSEGTIIEPTVEEGFQSLDTIQRFTGVPYTEDDLQQAYRFFTLRKKYYTDSTRQSRLNIVFNYFTSLQLPKAVALMDSIDNVTSNTPKISVSSFGSPSENGATGTFIIAATNITSNTIVSCSVSGTAAGTHYIATPAITSNILLTPSSPSDTITIAAVDDTLVNPKETILFTINEDTGYIIQKKSASLTIIDNETPPCSGLMIVNAPAAPLIDGAADAAWAKAPLNLINETISGTIQTGSTWQAMYDSVNLYLLVQVKDTNLSNQGANIYDHDGVEIFIAGNNSKAGAYTANDHQYRFNWNQLPYNLANITGNTGSKTGIVYAVPTTTGGYTLEALIPWSTIGGATPYNGKPIGFDIDINDQHDNKGPRESTAGWNDINSDDYQNTAGFGTAELTVCTATTTLSAPVIASIDNTFGKQGNPFTYPILASNTPINYQAVALPAGLSIDASTGIISGMPTVSGSFNVTITATNIIGSDTETLTIIIYPIPVISSATDVHGKEGYAFSYSIIASNTPTNYSALGLPQGLAVDSATGIISGIAKTFGVFNTTITAANSIGADTKTIVITIDSTPAVMYSFINASRQTSAAVAIQWIVDSELFIKQYEVQRSTDSINFTTISIYTLIGNENKNGVVYNALDGTPPATNIYYRIKGSSLYSSNSFYYSSIVKVDKINPAGVYPNPVTGNYINIPFTIKTASKYSVRVLNYIGQPVYIAFINVDAGTSIYYLQLSKKIIAGCYQLELINEAGARTVYKIVIENN